MTDHTVRFDGMSTTGQFATIEEIRAAARDRASAGAWTYVTAGAGDGRTAQSNHDEFAKWWLVPRYAPVTVEPSLVTKLWSTEVPAPLFTAPFGLDHVLHPDGVLAVARAHREFPIPLIVSRSTAAPLEEVARVACGVPLLFQLLPTGTTDDFMRLAERARDAGYLALVVTLDGASLGWRDRVREARFAPDMSSAWGNFRTPAGSIDLQRLQRVEHDRRPQLSYEEIADCARTVGLPWVAKGVLSAEEAAIALDAGAAALYVSNHGGRALDSVPPSLAVLREVAAIAAMHEGEVPVLFDGGIHRGNDVLKALALGANAAGFARLVVSALIAGGENVVLRLFELLRQELENGLTLLGRQSVEELRDGCVRRA